MTDLMAEPERDDEAAEPLSTRQDAAFSAWHDEAPLERCISSHLFYAEGTPVTIRCDGQRDHAGSHQGTTDGGTITWS